MAHDTPNMKGLDAFLKKLDALADIEGTKGMLASAMVIQRYSQENAPVDTGFMRSSPTTEETDNGALLKYGANYSYYQEFGTQYMEGRFFVQRAIDEHQDDALKAAQNQIKSEMEAKIK
jgi:HK97 gp10 family phage protein